MDARGSHSPDLLVLNPMKTCTLWSVDQFSRQILSWLEVLTPLSVISSTCPLGPMLFTVLQLWKSMPFTFRKSPSSTLSTTDTCTWSMVNSSSAYYWDCGSMLLGIDESRYLGRLILVSCSAAGISSDPSEMYVVVASGLFTVGLSVSKRTVLTTSWSVSLGAG